MRNFARMYLNCKYPYYRFNTGLKKTLRGCPMLSFLLDWNNELTGRLDEDPVQLVKEKNERLKIELKHKRYGTPLPPKEIRIKYQQRILN